MKKVSTLFLKVVIWFLGLGVLALCVIWIPFVIGEFNMSGYDPILIGMYVPAIPFFFALYQSLKLLKGIESNKVFEQSSVDALKKIKYCGFLISILYAAGSPYIFMVAEQDDAPGAVAIALVIISASFVIGVAAGLFQGLLQSAVDMKSENDLTV